MRFIFLKVVLKDILHASFSTYHILTFFFLNLGKCLLNFTKFKVVILQFPIVVIT